MTRDGSKRLAPCHAPRCQALRPSAPSSFFLFPDAAALWPFLGAFCTLIAEALWPAGAGGAGRVHPLRHLRSRTGPGRLTRRSKAEHAVSTASDAKAPGMLSGADEAAPATLFGPRSAGSSHAHRPQSARAAAARWATQEMIRRAAAVPPPSHHVPSHPLAQMSAPARTRSPPLFGCVAGREPPGPARRRFSGAAKRPKSALEPREEELA